MDAARDLPVLALTAGDPAGIGPEIALAALADADLARRARLVVLGPAALRPTAVPAIALDAVGQTRGHAWIETPTYGAWELGRVQESAGRAALAALRAGHELAIAGRVDALVTGPVSKEGLHLGGERVEGQTELLGRWCGVTRFEMLAIAGPLRVLLLTRHMPLARRCRSARRSPASSTTCACSRGAAPPRAGRPRLAVWRA